nr:alpha/beta hydrolase domain-containing protein [Symmachiella macrocystis]
MRELVPRSGPDGNEVGCLSPPEVAVPVATYTSWRLRSEEGGAANELLSLTGSYLPFPISKSAREKTGDPRQSIEERYGTLETYLQQLAQHCLEYEQTGYLLEEDTQRIMKVQRDRVAPFFNRKIGIRVPGDNPPKNDSPR